MTETTVAERIPAGRILYFSTGEYSDYTIHGVFRALVEIDSEALWKEYLIHRPNGRNPSFVTWLFKNGMIEPMESWEVWADETYPDYKPKMEITHWEASEHE